MCRLNCSEETDRERSVDPILLIDDEESTLNILTEILENDGYKVLTARNGGRGAESFQLKPGEPGNHRYDHAVKDGLDTMLELAKKDSSVPIVAISAGGSIPKERYLEMAGYFNNTSTLAKPFTSESFLP